MLRALGTILFAIAAAAGVEAQPRYGGASALEQVQLPTYCYPWYVDQKYFGQPGYSIPGQCGLYMNHYCPGLLDLIRAQKATDPPNKRRSNAARAIDNFEYTLRHMTKECPIRQDVENAKLRASTILRTVK